MNLKKEELHITFTPKLEANYKDFFQSFNNVAGDYKENNIIIDFSNFSISIDELLQFKNISKKKITLGTSFVIIKSGIDLDEIPDELIIVPTFQEAIDIIDMDEMTRSLDF